MYCVSVACVPPAYVTLTLHFSAAQWCQGVVPRRAAVRDGAIAVCYYLFASVT